ncbi:MAG TPA: GAF domain-containing SpoIIE family protein phosphatase, partial [Solirubrobacteraceae bacterium]|nr:GAF domain-containing SpoIIE family protein phosphatase [Solirubrobacteraceae bacterium]
DEHGEPEQTTIASRVARAGVAPAAVRDAETALRVAAGGISELSGDHRALVVPLTAGRLAVGAMTLVREEPSQPFRSTDVGLIEELGRRAGIAIESARVTRERAHVATTLQRSLLPPSLPEIPGLSIAARFRAAGEANQVGGDFYDVFDVDGSWMVVMGDVTGKGAEAAAITAVARYTVRTAAHYESEPAEVLRSLNEALLRESGATRRLCTAVCLRVDGVSDGGRPRVLVASAGHPLPWLVAADGSLTEVCRPGPLLGAFDSASWRSTDLRLDPSAALVLYTDGVTDTSGAQGRFGVERLRSVLREAAGGDAAAIAAAVDDALRRFQDGPQDDDVALLVLCAATAGNAPTLRGVPSPAP